LVESSIEVIRAMGMVGESERKECKSFPVIS
jgi:hypothetical protein